jgi:hypothetical protein
MPSYGTTNFSVLSAADLTPAALPTTDSLRWSEIRQRALFSALPSTARVRSHKQWVRDLVWAVKKCVGMGFEFERDLAADFFDLVAGLEAHACYHQPAPAPTTTTAGSAVAAPAKWMPSEDPADGNLFDWWIERSYGRSRVVPAPHKVLAEFVEREFDNQRAAEDFWFLMRCAKAYYGV